MYSPNAWLPNPIAITTENSSPQVTHAIDSLSASPVDGACAWRWR